MTLVKHNTSGPNQTGTWTFGLPGATPAFTIDQDGNVTVAGTITGGGVASSFQSLVSTSTPAYELAIEDPHTLIWRRVTFAGAGSDLWENVVNSQRTGYANERGELRSRAYDATSVAFRCQSNVAGNGTTVHILEAALSDNTVEFYVDAQGNAATTAALTVGTGLTVTGAASIGSTLSVTTSATVAGSAVITAAAWTTWTDMASISANATQGTPHLQSRAAPGNMVQLRGQLVIGAAGITSGSTIFTLPAGQRPQSGARVWTIRFTGTGAASANFTVNTDGTVTCSANLVLNNTINFDPVMFDTLA